MKTSEEKEKWLCRYSIEMLIKKRYENDRDEFALNYMLPKSQNVTDMPMGSHEDGGLERFAEKLEEKKERVREQTEKCIRVRREITDAMDAIEGRNKETYKLLIQLKYLNCYVWKKVAREMCVSQDHAKGYLRRKAIEALKIDEERKQDDCES